jgi:hypothetical protein
MQNFIKKKPKSGNNSVADESMDFPCTILVVCKQAGTSPLWDGCTYPENVDKTQPTGRGFAFARQACDFQENIFWIKTNKYKQTINTHKPSCWWSAVQAKGNVRHTHH